MSVRDRVKELESMNEESKDPPQGKKFFFPGKKKSNEAPSVMGIPQTRSKPSILSEFEANLEEVWSVRKNIHHNQNPQAPNALSSNFKNPIASSLSVPKSYSRHGALNGHQQEASHGIPLNINNVKTRRPPLHENNSFEVTSQARSTRATGFSLPEALKKQTDTMIHREDIFPVTNRKRTFKSGNESFKFSGDTFLKDGHTHTNDHKLSYAQKMAEAHLKSAGLGQYTPKQTGYSKMEVDGEEDGNSVKWRKLDDISDEFSF